MGDINRRKRYVVQNYSTYSKTIVQQDGESVYFHSVISGQVKDVHIMGDNSSQINQLPFIETLEIHSASNVDLKELRITGNRVKVYNSASAAITVQTGVTGSLTYENINAKCTSVAFFDGTYWRVEDGQQIGDLKPWHKNFGAGTQSLPWGWVAMDGSTISDAESPFNGQTLEDLNGDGRFFRGGAISGTAQAFATEDLYAEIFLSGGGHQINRINTPTWISNISAGSAAGPATGSQTQGAKISSMATGETRPINMSVVWIIKIK